MKNQVIHGNVNLFLSLGMSLRCAYPLLIAVFLLLNIAPAHAQRQLVLTKGEKVMLRLYPGDEITISLKDSRKRRMKSYINALSDSGVMLHTTHIPFQNIERIWFKRSSFQHVVGGLLVTGGVAYFLIDQINVVLVNGEKASLDEKVTIPSVVMIGTGLPLLLLRKKYQTIGRRYRLRMVDKGSAFWKPDLRQNMSENPFGQ
jgi:hypothetical protein